MLSKCLIPLCFIFITSLAYATQSFCTKEELLASYTVSSKFNTANEFFKSKDYELAIPIIKELLLESKNNGDKDLEIYSLFLEAELLYNNKSYSKSLQSYNQVIALLKDAYHPDLKFYALIAIGNINITSLKKFEEAIPYFKEAEKLILNTSCPEKKALLYNILGNTNLILKKYEESERYYNLELATHKEFNNEIKIAITYSNIGNLLYEQYKDKEAETYFLKSLHTFSKKDSANINIRQQINENLSLFYGDAQQHKKAYAYLNQSNILKDSIWNRDKVWELAEIEKQIEVTQKQQEVDLLQAENKIKATQRNGLLLSAIILCILLATGFYFYKEKVKSNKIISTQKEDLDALNTTKDKLFSIVSHDLRSSVNALKTSNNSLSNAVINKDMSKVTSLLNTNSNIVNGAYNLLDNLLNWALLQTKQSYFEIAEQRLYFIVEQVTYNYTALLTEKDLTLTVSIPKKKKVMADQESLKIILRNLIDNAIKFSQQKGEINIYCRDHNTSFCNLIIEDTGIGMNEKTRLSLLKDSNLLSKKVNEHIIGTGLGLQLCKSMIKKNNGTFLIESKISVGTKMIVSLPENTPLG